METLTYLDTHVAVWLYAGQIERFGPKVRKRLENGVLRVSPMVLLELQYLYEIGRINKPNADVHDYLAKTLGLSLGDVSFSDIAIAASELSWTRDPFDRLITAEAQCTSSELITADQTIKANYPMTLWD